MQKQFNVDSDAETNKPKSLSRYFTVAARVLMGGVFLVFGLNGFLHFIPQPKTAMPESAAAFAGALMKTGYMFPMIAGTQVLVGVLLLLNRFVPLALALIAPVIVNIIAFHLFWPRAAGYLGPLYSYWNCTLPGPTGRFTAQC